MKLKLFYLILLSCWFGLSAQSQILKVSPSNPITTDSVVIIYDATKGDQGLMGYEGDVYAHTGLITSQSTDGHDWKHVVTNWGENTPETKMQRIGTNLYKISFCISTFYHVDPAKENVLRLAFVFRSADAGQTARSANGTDIFYNINLRDKGNFVSYSETGSRMDILSTEGKLSLTAFTPSDIKVSYLPEGQTPADTSYTVISEPDNIPFSVEEHNSFLLLSTQKLKIKVEKFPIRLKFIRNGDTLLREDPGIYSQAGSESAGFQITSDEAFYGTGSRSLPINRRGYDLQIYNQAHYSYGKGEPNLNIAIPVVVSSRGYLLYFENHTPGELDIDSEQSNKLTYHSETMPLSYFFISGINTDTLLSQYTQLTGRQPLPPLWALGYIQSRYGYENTDQAQSVVRNMKKFGIPLDAIVLDLYWFGSPATMGNLTWDYSRFADPVRMINDFSTQGVKTILITEPYFTKQSSHYSYLDSRKFFALNKQGQTYVLDNFWAGPAALLDLTKPASFDWMWWYYQKHVNEGIAGWWCDLGEPEDHPSDMVHAKGSAREIHNLYSLIWAGDIYRKYTQVYPEKRLFDLIRSGYAGMQRFSTFPWSGDTHRDWESFQGQIPLILGMSMSGVSYMHTDIGGFTGNSQNNELYTRWMQFGAFSPVMRAHGVTFPTEPYLYPTYYRNIVKKFIKLRYQLLPYNYTLAWQNHIDGRPLAMPLVYFEPDNPVLQSINDEYYWGRQILVAPVTTEGATTSTIILPKGKWINFWTNQSYDGNQQITVDAPLDKMPIFVKAGSFIPMATPKLTTDNYIGDSLIIMYYPDIQNDTSSFTLFCDDGKTKGSWEKGEYQLLHFHGDVSPDQMSITLNTEGQGYAGMPDSRQLLFELKRVNNSPSKITLNGENIPGVNSEAEYQSLEKAAFWDSRLDILYIHFLYSGEASLLLVKDATLGIADNAAEGNTNFSLGQPVPQPFIQNVRIPVNISQPGAYQLQIFDLMGHLIYQQQTFFNQTGSHNFRWDSGAMPSGMYTAIVSDKQGHQAFIKLIKTKKHLSF